MGRRQWPPRVHHHKPSGQDRVRVDGRDVYLGPHGSDRARAAYARLVAELAAGGPPAAASAPPLTVADVAADWWATEATRYSARGREADGFRRALAPLVRLYGPTPAGDFRADQLEAVRMAMATGSWRTSAERDADAARGRPDGWCRNVVNRRVGRIRTVWRWAERRGHVPEGRWAHLCALPALAGNDARVRQTADVREATWEELQLVLAACNRPVRAMLLVQWHTGMRSGEVRIMRPCDLDRSGPDVWVYRPSQHKQDWRGQPRAVPVGPRAQAVLAPFLLEAGPQEFLFRPEQSRTRGHYLATTYAQAVRRAALNAGVPGFHPYQLRHAAKTRFARECGLEAARAQLGQKSLGTTNDYGEALDLKLARDAARKLG